MAPKVTIRCVLAACACVLLVGCMPKMTIEEMKAEMPKRPVELDRLDAFLGKWKFEGEAKMAMLDEPLHTSGTSETKWDGDRWFIVSRGVMSMEHFGDSQTLETWTYDIHDKKYRSTWVDSMGMIGSGVGTYDEDDGTWHMKATSHGPWGKSTMKGWLRFPEPDRMEWWMAEYQGLMKVMEMGGSAKRVE